MSGEAIGKYLSIARRAHAALLDKKLKPYNISHGQILLLFTLYRKEGISQCQLCQIYNLDKAGVNRSIKKLKDNDFITEKKDPEDRRRKKIFLTDRAIKFKPKLKQILNNVESQIRNGLTEEEIKTYFKVMKKICQNLQLKGEA
ncbi:MAG: MarR family winged helix-turn-helix transcriptional regulator [Halanaerobiaceae bacterium]